ncbi:hypothetical protein LL912_21610 [Niabella sp. CC-SYL272]|uniref:hypothetical protein n=1 Tax=Niabella agricola TaxID=2891571 RepID=UPI001F2B01CA|nr:hypothetical protein [Niabella agricola]MCF3111399.1 hypothetical protein [Niabella agricola]
MFLLPIIIIAIATGLLVFLLLSRNDKTVHQKQQVEAAGAELAATRAAYEKLETRLFEIIEHKIDPKYTREIREGEVTIGMPAEFLLMAWGNPSEIRTQEGEETWVYPQEKNTAEPTRFTEVLLLDKKVRSWKDN